MVFRSTLILLIAFFTHALVLSQFPCDTVLTGTSSGNIQISGTDFDELGGGQLLVTGNFRGTATFGGQQITSNGALSDIFLAKFDQFHNLLWIKTYGGSGNDNSAEMEVDNYGNLVLHGAFTSPAQFDGQTLTSAVGNGIFTARIRPDGTLHWIHTSEGGYTGTTGVNGNGNEIGTAGSYTGNMVIGPDTLVNPSNIYPHIYYISYDSSGNLLWTWEGGGQDEADNASEIFSGPGDRLYFAGVHTSFAVLGQYSYPVSDFGSFILRFGSTGNIEWMHHLTTYGWSSGIQQASYDRSLKRFLVAGKFEDFLDFGDSLLNSSIQFGKNLFMASIDTMKNTLWAKRYGFGGFSSSESVKALNWNSDLFSVLVTGEFEDSIALPDTVLYGTDSRDIYMAEYDLNGDMFNAWAIPGTSLDLASALAVHNQRAVLGGNFFTDVAISGNTYSSTTPACFIWEICIEPHYIAVNDPLPDLTAWPNPMNSHLNLRFEPFPGTGQAEIYDLQGRLVLRESFDGSPGEIQLNLETAAAGALVLRLNLNGQHVQRMLVRN